MSCFIIHDIHANAYAQKFGKFAFFVVVKTHWKVVDIFNKN